MEDQNKPTKLRTIGIAGFSLVELMIVILIIGIIGGVGVPLMQSMSAKPGAQYAADELYSVIMEAKMQAIQNNSPASITFNVASSEYSYRNNVTVRLSKYRGNVIFTNSPNGLDQAPVNQLTFSPQGFATASGSVYIREITHNTFYRVRTSYAGVTTVDRWSQGANRWN